MIDGVNGKIAGVSLDEYTGRKLGVVGCKARVFYRICTLIKRSWNAGLSL